MPKPPAYNKNQKSPFLHPPTYIAYNGIHFLICDTPSNSNVSRYLDEFKLWNVTDVVRCCKATYSEGILNEQGIKVHDWMFTDGEIPPKDIIDDWLDLINLRFKTSNSDSHEQTGDEEKALGSGRNSSDEESYSVDHNKYVNKMQPCIAAHCVAGLGRAPVLVAIALIEEGMDPLRSIEFIREHRRGAINKNQMKFLEAYKKRRQPGCCIS